MQQIMHANQLITVKETTKELIKETTKEIIFALK